MTVPDGQWLDDGPERWACRGRSAVDRGPQPGQWPQNLVSTAARTGPEDQAAFRKLLGALAAHVNDLDPVPTACEAVEDITAR